MTTVAKPTMPKSVGTRRRARIAIVMSAMRCDATRRTHAYCTANAMSVNANESAE